MFEPIFSCSVCQQSCRVDFIYIYIYIRVYIYNVKKNKCPNSNSMRMLKWQCLFAFTQNVKSFIHWNKITITKCLNVCLGVFNVLQRGCKFIYYVKILIHHFIKCYFIYDIAHFINHNAMCQFWLMIAI